jgi:cold shock CspA family protein
MTGAIKFFDIRKRFGIIIPAGVSLRERDRHVFFYEDVLEGGSTAHAGQEVEFSLMPNYPSPRALTVRLLGKTAYVPIDQHPNRKAAYGD